jgi:hypothetical protein
VTTSSDCNASLANPAATTGACSTAAILTVILIGYFMRRGTVMTDQITPARELFTGGGGQ